MKCIWNLVQHDEKNLLQHSPPHCLKVLLLIFITLSQKIWTFLKGANCKSTKEEFSSSYSKPEYTTSLTLKTQTRLCSTLKKPEKLVLLEPKIKKLEQNSSLIHVRTRQFEIHWILVLVQVLWFAHFIIAVFQKPPLLSS